MLSDSAILKALGLQDESSIKSPICAITAAGPHPINDDVSSECLDDDLFRRTSPPARLA